MSLSERDKKILIVIVPLVVVLGYWFLLLAPKREAASSAAAELETVQAELTQAQTQATTVQAAKTNFARDYAAVVALGKAIPTSVDMPSLLVQLEQAARGTGIKFDGITMGDRTVPEAPAGGAAPAPGGTASAPPAGTAPSGQPPQSAPGQAAASAQGAADAASAPPPGGTSGTAATPGDPAATGAAAPTAAGALESVTLEFGFTGSFFELADIFHRLKRFVYMNGDKVRVRGRLMTIDSVSYQTSPETFPTLSATVHATVFLSPKAEGVTAGATPTGPAPAAAGAEPVSTASGGSSSPTPTATATP
jgi:hypothetical protein